LDLCSGLIDNAAYSVILSFIQYCLPHSKDVRLQQYFLLPLLAVNHSTWRGSGVLDPTCLA
jgi:hypothetical protein